MILCTLQYDTVGKLGRDVENHLLLLELKIDLLEVEEAVKMDYSCSKSSYLQMKKLPSDAHPMTIR